MNILLFSQNAWDETNSFGNTVSNFFENWNEDLFSHFYIRKQLPMNRVAKHYYCLPVGTVVKKLLGKSTSHCSFQAEDIPSLFNAQQKEIAREKQQIQKIHRKNNVLAHIVYEELWMSRIWLDREFQAFIREQKPDIFFAFAANAFLLEPLIRYLKKHTKTKIVLFIADDVYGQYEKTPGIRGMKLRRRYRQCIAHADLIYGISEGMQERYASLFGREIKLLRKGCNFSAPIGTQVGTPLRIVYAGNLLYGRTETLAALADTLGKLRQEGLTAKLEIYTPTCLEAETKMRLEKHGTAVVMEAQDYTEICRIQNEADVVLHAESFEKAQIDLTKYSFSTKIIDCIQSGSAVLAVGPRESAAMECMRRIDGIQVVDDLRQLEGTLRTMLSHRDQLPLQAAAIRNATIREYDIKTVRLGLRQDFLSLLSQK